MSDGTALRGRVLQLTGLSCLGLAAELALTGHYQSLVQWLPLALCAVGAAVATLALLNRAPGLVRWAPYTLLLGGMFGMWEHLEHNFAFASEIRPTAGIVELIPAALTGASPLLAPGALTLLGALLWLCTRAPAKG